MTRQQFLTRLDYFNLVHSVIEWQLSGLVPERLFFNEQFMHVVRQGAGITASKDG
jgi:hypothetical protein